MREFENEIFEKGRLEGLSQGREDGARKTLINSIKNLMKNLKVNAVKAMEILGMGKKEASDFYVENFLN